ncbi:MAG: hypothetical protein MZV63_33915 [Marinilabiliales bacterium]|nr:hypothetical protein [Marinilabiliales bacterium]
MVGERMADVQRRFVRCEEDDRIDSAGIEVVHSEGPAPDAGTASWSSLFDMKTDGTLDRGPRRHRHRRADPHSGRRPARDAGQRRLVQPAGSQAPLALRARLPSQQRGHRPGAPGG